MPRENQYLRIHAPHLALMHRLGFVDVLEFDALSNVSPFHVIVLGHRSNRVLSLKTFPILPGNLFELFLGGGIGLNMISFHDRLCIYFSKYLLFEVACYIDIATEMYASQIYAESKVSYQNCNHVFAQTCEVKV